MAPEPEGQRRRRTFLAGHRAERLAVVWLALKGYRVLARRYGGRGGEIDVIARRGAVIAVVEVKARPTLVEALEAVTPLKRRRIARTAALWLAHNSWASDLTLRGDIVAIVPWRLPRHLPDAMSLVREP